MNDTFYRNVSENGKPRVELLNPTSLPNASSFLWNTSMVLQANCRGYVTSQFMQPEPAKYSHAPLLEAKTFIQPEQPYYTEHPARFVFIKNEDTGEVVSAPYEPMKSSFDAFNFSSGKGDIRWTVSCFGIEVEMTLSLTKHMNVELWNVSVVNQTEAIKNISIYPYFTVGYMSWMNQSAKYNHELNTIIASSITPYQKVEQYFQNMELKDKTCLIASRIPDSWTTSYADFVGTNGLTNPDGVNAAELSNMDSHYETPVAVMQYTLNIKPEQKESFHFVFGPAKDESEIKRLREFVTQQAFDAQVESYKEYIDSGQGCLTLNSPEPEFNEFVNHWLPRQMFYHGDVNRLSTDPQTRNFVQDAMSMIYIKPEVTRERILFALAQQKASGQMPDGILLTEDAELKYINQVPHADHCVWLPICLLSYLEETNDTQLLFEPVGFADSSTISHVAAHIELAIEWLLSSTDERGLSYIEQGDWCDPMNMVGYKGKGVSAWLTMATLYALNCWIEICENYCVEQVQPVQVDSGRVNSEQNSVDKGTPLPSVTCAVQLSEYKKTAQLLKQTINQYFWQDNWFARGITDDGNLFGISSDKEGQIFVNPQSWSMLADVPNNEQKRKMVCAVNQKLATPYGVTMLAPSFTKMREDIGRVTQKSAGVAENGAVYNHASIFYGFALYRSGFAQQGFDVLSRMLPSSKNVSRVGQLPLYIPNYYRGAYYQHPEYAGRSSQLFNTGTVAWYYKTILDGLCGLSGCSQGLKITPNLPKQWDKLDVQRRFRGAHFNIRILRKGSEQSIVVNGKKLTQSLIENIETGKHYEVEVIVPEIKSEQPKLIIVMGVSGSGKSLVSQQLAQSLGMVYMDGDDFHSKQAKAKMAKGQPLTDDDREPWLERMTNHLALLENNDQSVVLAYSGLKKAHRDKFKHLGFNARFVNLEVSEEVLKERLSARDDHFFDPSLLSSQLSAMEAFDEREQKEAIVLNAARPLKQVVTEIERELVHG